MRSATTTTASRIISVGGVRGDLVVPNDDLVGSIDSSDEWIRRRTGIVTRRHARKEVLVEDLAEQAGRSAIEAAGIDPEQVDVVIVASISWMQTTPAMAPLVAHRLGTGPGTAAFDANAACAGYCYGIGQADAMIRSGLARHVLVIGAEKISDFIEPTDRTMSFIMGDGSGAALVGPSDTPGIGPTVWGSDGRLNGAIGLTHSWLDFKYAADDERVPWPTARQDGPSVYRWTQTALPELALKAIADAGLTPKDIEVFVPHQANLRIVEGLHDRLGLADDVIVARDIVDTGNTSSASVPLATERLLREGLAQPGQIALQFGFGAGLAYAAQVVRLPEHVGVAGPGAPVPVAEPVAV
ncbi:beta-ketoacyl-ACP synthase 3 [Curtobacterium sp. MCBD17_040]|uniref:beta-ketoacyl-ACP synthase 3 n=1 Tax=Curtobacterium sp. MCBD17_040 TaxID=2175674 RepID=UPI000DA79513|nr:beta-ketoacyl-ACP synthase 3 [Curtobacterium sp. MCBD17_040]WIB64324.1 beta-ketoacyl-ACP synthase 3 [Curtobacterium sp. MCBD17_040]